MANFTISELKPASVIDATAAIPCTYRGKTYQLEVANLVSLFGTGVYSSLFAGDSIVCDPNPVTTTGTVDFSATGLMSLYAGSTDPSGWLICNGRTFPKTNAEYANLYAVIGDTYGVQSDTSRFAIPKMSGLSAFGLDNMGGVTAGRLTANNLNGAIPTTLGSSGGSISQTLTASQCPLVTHSHSTGVIPFVLSWDTGTDSGNHSRNLGSVESYWTFDPSSYNADKTNNAYADANLASKSVGAATQVSATTSHPHIPPFILLNWIIKL